MQNNHRVLFYAIQDIIETPQQRVVEAGAFFTQIVKLPFSHVCMWNAVTGPFTAAVVITPQHIDARMRQHVHQPLLMMRKPGIIMRPRHPGEHAGHGHRRFRAAGSGVWIEHHALFFKLRIGLALITAKRIVLFAGGFANHHHQHGFFRLLADHRAFFGIFTNAYQRLVARKIPCMGIFDDAADVVGRRHHFGDVFIIAKQRGVVFIEEGRHQNDNQQARENADQTAQCSPQQTA
ncbi:hypothetical protein BN129_963 [Cronobacter sakazakii 701]|nr:hypothetical protein BN129_963 [Cronobacter sakazakii 701]